MTIFERGSSAVLTVFAFSMSAFRRSAIQLAGKQQINNLWPARFVKDKICEKRARNIPDADAGERWLRNWNDCLTLDMFLDDKLSRMRIRQETAFILSFVPSLQSASCSLCWGIGVECDVSDSIFPQATFHCLFISVPISLCSNKNVLVIKGHSR